MSNNIALITDDNYALPTIVCIQSIIMTVTKETVIHVCTFGLSQENVKAFHALSNEMVQVTVDVFSSEEYRELLNKINQKSHVTPTALIKFELPNHFFDLEQILYIDSDIIIRQDLSELFSVDLRNYYLAASYEFYKYLENRRYKYKSHWDRSFYFNSGVMLMNLAKMRKDGISERLWQYKINQAKTTLMDQESLIAVCGERVLPLPIRWNFNPVFFNQEYIKEINEVYEVSYKNKEELLNDIAVIHYVGKKDKPWTYSTGRMREYWVNVYESVADIPDITPKADNDLSNRTNGIKNIYKKYGIEGLICYYSYRIKQKLSAAKG